MTYMHTHIYHMMCVCVCVCMCVCACVCVCVYHMINIHKCIHTCTHAIEKERCSRPFPTERNSCAPRLTDTVVKISLSTVVKISLSTVVKISLSTFTTETCAAGHSP